MAIYGRTGQVVEIVRIGTIDDVKALDGRKADKQDRDAIKAGSYVVVSDGGKERLYHLAFLRADGGSQEIAAAIEASAEAKTAANAADLERDWFLDVCAAGSVHIRQRGKRPRRKTMLLPVFSTDTEYQASMLRVMHCRLARDGSGLYHLNEPPTGIDDLPRIAAMFRASYEAMKAREAAKTEVVRKLFHPSALPPDEDT